MSQPPQIVLVGLMGAGKSSVAAALAERLDAVVLDNDSLLFDLAGADARTLEEREGTAWLHDRELEVLEDAMRRPPPLVITAAASVIDHERASQVLAPATVVWLRTTITTLLRRLEHDIAATNTHRPERGDLEDLLTSQAARREPRYAALADLVVDTDGRGPDAIADQILGHAQSETPNAPT